MTKTAKAPASAATLTGAVENGTTSQMAQPSTKYDTTTSIGGQTFRVADLLHPGAENAISRRDLMSMTGFSDRELRLKIEAERRQGCPILSDNRRGYWLSDDPAEIIRFSRSMKRRAAEIRLTAACVEKAVAE